LIADTGLDAAQSELVLGGNLARLLGIGAGV
jgi:hypothetical protein